MGLEANCKDQTDLKEKAVTKRNRGRKEVYRCDREHEADRRVEEGKRRGVGVGGWDRRGLGRGGTARDETLKDEGKDGENWIE